MKRLLFIVFILSFLFGCSGSNGNTVRSSRRVTVFVGADSTLQQGVKVFAVMQNGTRTLIGVTGEGGGIPLDVESLRHDGSVCLLFEKEGFFTSAIWLSGYEFSDPDYIGLAKFTLP